MRIGVVGAGITGLAITYELARQGHDVRCFEAATPMQARSKGGTRIFRLAHRRPELVAWAMRARPMWDHWSAEAGERLVGTEGTVLSGDVHPWAEAMTVAGAPHTIADEAPGLPASPAGPVLLDPAGGAIRAAATGRFLLGRVGAHVVADVPVTGVSQDGAVTTAAGGAERFDSVVVTAGAGTAPLAAGAGIAAPSVRVHHARFTFPLRDPAATPPCWIESASDWGTDWSTYQHLAAPGRWAIGGHFGPADVGWDVGAETAVEHSREVVTRYAAEYVAGVEPTVVETVYCDFGDGLGDGLTAARAGRVLALWGDNLFKLAPVLAAEVGRAAAEVSLPEDLAAVRN